MTWSRIPTCCHLATSGRKGSKILEASIFSVTLNSVFGWFFSKLWADAKRKFLFSLDLLCWDLTVLSPYFFADTVSPVHRVRPRGRRDVFLSLSLLLLSHTRIYIEGRSFSRCLCVCPSRASRRGLFFPSFFCLSACLEFVRVTINSELTLATRWISELLTHRSSSLLVLNRTWLKRHRPQSLHRPFLPFQRSMLTTPTSPIGTRIVTASIFTSKQVGSTRTMRKRHYSFGPLATPRTTSSIHSSPQPNWRLTNWPLLPWSIFLMCIMMPRRISWLRLTTSTPVPRSRANLLRNGRLSYATRCVIVASPLLCYGTSRSTARCGICTW